MVHFRNLKLNCMNCTIWSKDQNVSQELKKQVDHWSTTLKCDVVNQVGNHDNSNIQFENSDAHLIHVDENNHSQLDVLSMLNLTQSFVIFIVTPQCKFIKVIKASGLDCAVWPMKMSSVRDIESRLIDLHSMSSESDDFFTGYKRALEFLSTNIHRLSKKEIVLPCVRGYMISRTEDIVRFESEGLYSWAFFANGSNVLTNKSMKHFERVLEESSFIRICQEHIINLQYLESCQRKEGVSVTLQDGKTLGVSIRRAPLFMEAFTSWSKRRKYNPSNR